jgi:hypothetical protein
MSSSSAKPTARWRHFGHQAPKPLAGEQSEFLFNIVAINDNTIHSNPLTTALALDEKQQPYIVQSAVPLTAGRSVSVVGNVVPSAHPLLPVVIVGRIDTTDQALEGTVASVLTPLRDVRPGRAAFCRGRVTAVEPTTVKGKPATLVTLDDGTTSITVLFYHRVSLAVSSAIMILAGVPSMFSGKLQLLVWSCSVIAPAPSSKAEATDAISPDVSHVFSEHLTEVAARAERERKTVSSVCDLQFRGLLHPERSPYYPACILPRAGGDGTCNALIAPLNGNAEAGFAHKDGSHVNSTYAVRWLFDCYLGDPHEENVDYLCRGLSGAAAEAILHCSADEFSDASDERKAALLATAGSLSGRCSLSVDHEGNISFVRVATANASAKRKTDDKQPAKPLAKRVRVRATDVSGAPAASA